MLTHSHVCNDATVYGSRPDHNSKPGGFGIATDPEGANDGQEDLGEDLAATRERALRLQRPLPRPRPTPSAKATRATRFTRCSPTTRTWTRAEAAICAWSSATRRARAVSVKTYSPYLDGYLTDPSNEFTLENVDFG